MDKEKKKRLLWAKLAGAKLICQECGRNSIDNPELRFTSSFISYYGDWDNKGEVITHCQLCGWSHPRSDRPETWTWQQGTDSENDETHKKSDESI